LLRQALRREQVWLTASIFLFGDVTMVLLGGFGIGRFLGRWPLAKLLLTALGALYIFWFGVGVFRQMFHPKHSPWPKRKYFIRNNQGKAVFLRSATLRQDGVAGHAFWLTHGLKFPQRSYAANPHR